MVRKFSNNVREPLQFEFGSCLTLRKEFSEGDMCTTKQEILLEEAPGQRAAGYENPGELCHVTISEFRLMGQFQFWQSFDSESFLVAHVTQLADDSERNSGGVDRHALPNSSGWW